MLSPETPSSEERIDQTEMEMSDAEKIASLQREVDGIKAAVVMLLEDRKHFQLTRQLPEDPTPQTDEDKEREEKIKGLKNELGIGNEQE